MKGLDWAVIYGRLPTTTEPDNSHQANDENTGVGEFDSLPSINHLARLDDDRRRCCECLNRAQNGRCIAAAKGVIVASRGYTPNPEWLRRCKGYAPFHLDPDQRHGNERWARLPT